MKKAIAIALCVAAAISFNGCKKETTTGATTKTKAEKQDNYVQQQAKKYTRGITGVKDATKKQQNK